jgi:hypothetical protein
VLYAVRELVDVVTEFIRSLALSMEESYVYHAVSVRDAYLHFMTDERSDYKKRHLTISAGIPATFGVIFFFPWCNSP